MTSRRARIGPSPGNARPATPGTIGVSHASPLPAPYLPQRHVLGQLLLKSQLIQAAHHKEPPLGVRHQFSLPEQATSAPGISKPGRVEAHTLLTAPNDRTPALGQVDHSLVGYGRAGAENQQRQIRRGYRRPTRLVDEEDRAPVLLKPTTFQVEETPGVPHLGQQVKVVDAHPRPALAARWTTRR